MPEQRQTKTDFWEMLEKLTPKVTRHDEGGKEVIQASASVESQPTSAYDRDRALTSVVAAVTTTLMEQVCQPANLNRAYARVKSNKGAPGTDGMTIGQLAGWIRQHKQELIRIILDRRARLCRRRLT
jgi:hypothetical protein